MSPVGEVKYVSPQFDCQKFKNSAHSHSHISASSSFYRFLIKKGRKDQKLLGRRLFSIYLRFKVSLPLVSTLPIWKGQVFAKDNTSQVKEQKARPAGRLVNGAFLHDRSKHDIRRSAPWP